MDGSGLELMLDPGGFDSPCDLLETRCGRSARRRPRAALSSALRVAGVAGAGLVGLVPWAVALGLEQVGPSSSLANSGLLFNCSLFFQTLHC